MMMHFQHPKAMCVALGLLTLYIGDIYAAALVPKDIQGHEPSTEFPQLSRHARSVSCNESKQRDVLLQLVLTDDSIATTQDPDTPMNFWTLSTDKFTKRQEFAHTRADGSIVLDRNGFYLIYADLKYQNPTRRTDWYWYTVRINDRQFLRCKRDSDFWTSKIPGCRTSGAVYLIADQVVRIHSTEDGKRVEPGSFWGMVRIKRGRGLFRKQFGY